MYSIWLPCTFLSWVLPAFEFACPQMRSSHQTHPHNSSWADCTVRFSLCEWSACVCVRSPCFFHPSSQFSKEPEASEWSLSGLYLLAPLLSWASHNSSPPLTCSHCVSTVSVSLPSLSQAFRGGDFLPLSYKPVCLQYSVCTSNLAVVAPSHACGRNRKEEVHDNVVVCVFNSTVETLPSLPLVDVKG